MHEDLLTEEQWISIKRKFLLLYHDTRHNPNISRTKQNIIEKIEERKIGNTDVDDFSAVLLEVIYGWNSTKDTMINLIRELILIYEEITGNSLSDRIDLPPEGYSFDDAEIRRNYMNMVKIEHEMNNLKFKETETEYFHKILLRSQRTIDRDLSLIRAGSESSSKHKLDVNINLTEAKILFETLFNNIDSNPNYIRMLISKFWFQLTKSDYVKERILEGVGYTPLRDLLLSLETGDDEYKTELEMIKDLCVRLNDQPGWYLVPENEIESIISYFLKLGILRNRETKIVASDNKEVNGKLTMVYPNCLEVETKGTKKEINIADIKIWRIKFDENNL